MKLSLTRRHWNKLARTDPLWAVLTTAEKKGNRWEPEEFFANGRTIVADELKGVRDCYPALRLGTALDFGCGVGRLTQGLAQHFQHVTGIDISEVMLDQAREHNRHGARVSYLHNPRPDLHLLADNQFDFVYSLITLQHMEPEYAKRYIAEFVRVAAPGGAILFQVPSVRSKVLNKPLRGWSLLWLPSVKKRVSRWLRRTLIIEPVMEMHAIPRAEVEAALRAAGAEILNVYRYDAAGQELESWGYLARKP